MSVEKIVDQMVEFVAYVESFYSKGGVYDMGATSSQILTTTQKYINQVGMYSDENSLGFSGDSLDREHVRDMMIRDFGLVFPTPKTYNLKRVS
tara:strand:- start:155 stop:433 length:279 start_codon:yes stop_codon:yes gene_type:complete